MLPGDAPRGWCRRGAKETLQANVDFFRKVADKPIPEGFHIKEGFQNRGVKEIFMFMLCQALLVCPDFDTLFRIPQ